MRILVALGDDALLRGEAIDAVGRHRNVELAARGLAEIAHDHDLIVTHGGEGSVGYMLDLALHNALPDRAIATVITEVVVDAQDPAFDTPGNLPPSPEPCAIVELRSLRTLIDAGVLVICSGGGDPVTLGGDGTMRGAEAVVDNDLTASLLARRLDADLLVMLTDVDGDSEGGSMETKVEAASRFVEATGGRAAIGALEDVAETVRGVAGTQIAPTA